MVCGLFGLLKTVTGRSPVQIWEAGLERHCKSVLGGGSCGKHDIYANKEQLEREVTRIRSWDTTDANKQRILDFLRRAEVENISICRRLKYVYGARRLLETIPKDFDCFTTRDLEDFLLSMKDRYRMTTRETMWYSVKRLFEFIDRGVIFQGIRPNFEICRTKMPEDLLTEDEVLAMVGSRGAVRDRALIYILYEAGLRVGELLNLRRKDVAFDEYGAVLRVDGKTGERRVRIVRSVAYLREWLKASPKKGREDFVWISLNEYQTPIKHRVVTKILEDSAERVGIKKHVHPHLLRHSRATHLANKLTEQQLKVYFGWTGGSHMAAVYVHLSGRDIDNAILEVSGVKGPDMGPKSEEAMKDPKFMQYMMQMYKQWQATNALM